MLDEFIKKLDSMHIISPLLRYHLCMDFLLFGCCAIEVINLPDGVRRRRRGDITTMAFDSKGVHRIT